MIKMRTCQLDDKMKDVLDILSSFLSSRGLITTKLLWMNLLLSWQKAFIQKSAVLGGDMSIDDDNHHANG
jgi:hypothetical protein